MGGQCKISFRGNFSAIISITGMNPQSFATFIVQGYGVYITNSAHRICVTRATDVFQEAKISCQPVNNEEAVLITSSDSSAWISVLMLLGGIYNVKNPA